MAAILDAVKHPVVAFSNADRVVPIFPDGDGANGHASAADRIEILRSGTFIDRLVLTSWRYDLVESGEFSEQIVVGSVSPEFFSIVGLKTKTGRLPTALDENSGVLISELVARQMFPRLSDALSSRIQVGDREMVVVGVAPSARGTMLMADVWQVITPSALEDASKKTWVTPLVLLRSGTTPEALRTELDTIAARLTARYGNGRRPFSFRVGSIKTDPLSFRAFHGVMASAGLIVIIVACANVANLLLARALDRQPEHALRLSLGAPPSALARDAVSESIVLAVVGGVVGLLIGLWAMDLVLASAPRNLNWAGIIMPRMSWRVYAFAFGTSMIIAIVSAIAPALRIMRVDPGDILKQGSGTMTRAARRHDSLVVVQLSLALLLIFCCGSLLKAAVHIRNFQFGYDQRPIIAAHVAFRRDSTGLAPAFDDLVARARELPGARGASTLGSLQVDRNVVSSENANERLGFVLKRTVPLVGPRFFSTLGIRVIAGRDFIAGDGEAGAAIVDEKAAEALWPGESPIGHVLKLGDGQSTRPWLRVVGLIPQVTLHLPSDPDLPPEAGVYVTQTLSNNTSQIVVRSNTPAITATMLRRMIRQTYPKSIAWSRVVIWNDTFDAVVSSRVFMSGLFMVFAGFTLLLALAGLYGTLNYAVARRMREFAVRGALGATDAELRRLMWRQMMVAILAGTAIGGPAGMWAAKSLGAWTYDVFYADAELLLIAETILIGTALLACLGPARKAGRVDLSRVLREL